METENKLNKTMGPLVGVLALLVVLAVAGLFFYKGMYKENYAGYTATTPVQNVPSLEEIPVPEDEQDLVVLETELETMTAEVDEGGLFGLEELDAELANLDDLDAMLAEEVTQ